jgi:5'-nucleotidase
MKPLILLSNDDGIHAPGIRHLWEALHEANFAELVIAAPASEKSGTGVAITWDKPIHVQKVSWPEQTSAWSVDGNPADCVKMAEAVILKRKPDLIVAGINAGSNAGRNVLHSGTVGAVIEGALRDIPGVAFSCENGREPNFEVAKKYVAYICQYLLKNPLPKGTILNVNIPHAAKTAVKGMKWTRQGKGRWAESPYLHLETDKGLSYFLGGKPEERDEENCCDISWLKEGYLTAVPLYVHELTDERCLKEKKGNFENFSEELFFQLS